MCEIFTAVVSRAGLNEREAPGNVVTRFSKQWTQLRSVSHALVSTLLHMWLICSNRKLYHKKKIFLLPWHHPTIFFVVDCLTIFTAQIAHSHMYWGKLCLHSLADQNIHRLEKCSQRNITQKQLEPYHLPPGNWDQEPKIFRIAEAKIRLSHLIAAVTVYLPIRRWHCIRVSFTVLVSCNGEIAVRSYSLLWLSRQVAKLPSGLLYSSFWVRNDNTAINFETFTSSYRSRRFFPCDQGPTAGFSTQICLV